MLRRILRHKVENDNLILLMIMSIWKFIALYSTMSYDMIVLCLLSIYICNFAMYCFYVYIIVLTFV